MKVENDRVARTRQRLAVAKEKLEIVKGNERATTVFSPAKYPAPKVLDDFVPMYNSINPLSRIVHPDYDLDDELEEVVHRNPRCLLRVTRIFGRQAHAGRGNPKKILIFCVG